MNEEHSRPFISVPLSSSSFSWLHPHPASSATFIRGHTHTLIHTHKHQTCSSHKAALYSLGRVSALYVFAPVCVCAYMYVCVHAGISSLERVTNHKHTSLSLSIFLSSSLSLYFLFSLCPPWTMKDKHNLSSRSQPSPLQKYVGPTYECENTQAFIVAALYLELFCPIYTDWTDLSSREAEVCPSSSVDLFL